MQALSRFQVEALNRGTYSYPITSDFGTADTRRVLIFV